MTPTQTKLQIGEVYRYSSKKNPSPPIVDGLPNYFAVTATKGAKRCLLESGINPIAAVKAIDGNRVPAILIQSSPHKAGSADTPWQDTFNTDTGYIRYYGDNKHPRQAPNKASGNKALLAAFDCHQNGNISVRETSIPLIFFRSVRHKKKAKGFRQFQGFGVIRSVELVTQPVAGGLFFTNYSFEFVVFSMAKESEEFDWKWISSRRDPSMTTADTLSLAPAMWKEFVKRGADALGLCRRYVAKMSVIKTNDQKPAKGSLEQRVLETIYSFYEGKKSRFEGLAEAVSERIISSSAGHYHPGWITSGGGDKGIDFVGRIDVGDGFGAAKLVVLGQAKCERLNSPTGGNHIARTVARLKRGWIGAYVTTSYFSEQVQQEVIEDEYPILLIHGKKLAEEVIKMKITTGFSTVKKLLQDIDSRFESRIQNRLPDEILRM